MGANAKRPALAKCLKALRPLRRGDDINTQNITGQSTERKVQNHLRSIGVETEKPNPDIGVDLEVWHPRIREEGLMFRSRGAGRTKRMEGIGGSK